MKKPTRHKFFGTTIEEDLAQRPVELAIDAVGLWQIVKFGREGFEFSGSDLVDYVRRHILNLLEKGAKPVRGAEDGVHYWRVIDYGSSPDKITGAIIGEWLASGEDPNFGDVWFALPHIYEATKPDDANQGSRKLQ
jgi:hypothetical protein